MSPLEAREQPEQHSSQSKLTPSWQVLHPPYQQDFADVKEPLQVGFSEDLQFLPGAGLGGVGAGPGGVGAGGGVGGTSSAMVISAQLFQT